MPRRTTRALFEEAKREWEADPTNPPLLQRSETEMIYDHRVKVQVPHVIGVPTREAIELPDGQTVVLWIEVVGTEESRADTFMDLDMGSGRIRPPSSPVGILNVRFALGGNHFAERHSVRANDVLHIQVEDHDMVSQLSLYVEFIEPQAYMYAEPAPILSPATSNDRKRERKHAKQRLEVAIAQADQVFEIKI